MRSDRFNRYQISATSNRSIRSRLLVITCLFVVGILIATFAVRAFNKEAAMTAITLSPGSGTGSVAPVRAAAVQSPPAKSSVKVAVVTIRPTGFEPTEITEPKGLFLLAVENRSGLQTVQLRIDRVGGSRISDVAMPLNKHDLSQVLDLPPGQYVLSEAYHPEWQCKLTVGAQ